MANQNQLHKQLALLILFIFLLISSKSQSIIFNDTLNITKDSFNVTAYLKRYHVDSTSVKYEDIKSFTEQEWIICNDTINPKSIKPGKYYWFKFSITNNSSKDIKRLLYFNDFDRVKLYYNLNGTLNSFQAGERESIGNWSYEQDNHGLPIYIHAKEKANFYINCFNVNKLISRPYQFSLKTYQKAEAFQAFEMRSRMIDTAFLFLYLGVLFFSFMYFFVQFLFKKKSKEYLFYTLYILFTFLYSFRDLDKHYFLIDAFPFVDGIYLWSEAIFSYLSFLFYSSFVIVLLDLKDKITDDKNAKRAYYLIKGFIYILMVLLISDIIIKKNFTTSISYKVFYSARYFLYPLSFLYFFFILRIKKPFPDYYKFFVGGTICLMLGVGANLLIIALNFFSNDYYSFWANTVNFTRISVIAEVLFFSLGLSKKYQITFAEATVKTIQSGFFRDVLHAIENELTILQGSMTDEERAAHIIQTSEFIDIGLETMDTVIPLSLEYELEKKFFRYERIKSKEINLEFREPDKDLSKYKVPPLLLHPFIQNCFKHAFEKRTQKDKKIEVDIIEKNKKLKIQISDNGKGLSNNKDLSKSKGQKLIQDRINYFNELTGSKISFTVKNRTDNNGTIATILI